MLQSLRIPPLVPGVVQLWHASARAVCDSAAGEELRGLLSAEELERAERFHFAANRREYLVGRGLVRLVLARQLGVSTADLTFCSGPCGKPELLWPRARQRVHFNVSHSADAVVAAFAVNQEVGVDVEELARKVSPGVIEQAFTASEVAQFSSVPEKDRPAAVMARWTLKEAYLKARGDGLNLPLLGFSFAEVAGNRPRIGFSSVIDDDPARWSFFQTELNGTHVLALAVNSPTEPSIEIHNLSRILSAAEHHDCHPEYRVAIAG